MARSVALRLKNHRVIEVGDIEKIAQLVNDAASDTRNLSRALHRSDVNALGLVEGLQDLVDREIWKIPCRLEVKASFRIKDDVVAAQLYRIAREAVINANKHAQAREIVIAADSSRQGIVLSVTDDGVGFRNGLNNKPGLGLSIMKHRARSIGGRLEIDFQKRAALVWHVTCRREHSNHGREKRPVSAILYIDRIFAFSTCLTSKIVFGMAPYTCCKMVNLDPLTWRDGESDMNNLV
jgi:signal transduction histidine kinase